MADSKISALPASTVPLAGTEVLPIVQSSTTKQVSVANLTAGRDIAATSLTTAAVQATNSGGLAFKNSGGTTQITIGGGGGDNITLSTATNINPANAAVAISPTGTGTVAISPAGALTINPTTASTMNNVSVGATTAATGKFTSVTNTGLTSGRVTYATTGGLLTDSATLQFDGGNLGLGVTPTAWRATDRVFEIGSAGKAMIAPASGNNIYLATNWYISTAPANVYAANGYATRYVQSDGAHSWWSAPNNTGGAGASLSFTQGMGLDSSGIVTMNAYGAGAATFSASGVISSVSDETWKVKDGAPVNPDEMLQKLEPGYWFYNDEKKETFGEDRQLGFYAQNVHEAIGEEAAPTPEKYKDEEGNESSASKPWGYYDRSVLAVTVMSLKNALSTIEELKQRITALENR
jgi:hypothetical protein